MTSSPESVVLLIADDDPEDCMLMRDALREGHLVNDLRFVADGEELLDYLLHRGKYADPLSAPRPGLILLDLNMPRKDGREALKEIKEHPSLKSIPVVVFTTSKAEEDIYRSYELGVSSFITKPVTFSSLIHTVKTLGQYWFSVVALPGDQPR